MKNKFFEIKKLSNLLKTKNFKNKKIVMCHGVFDLLHIGHINHLKSSKKFGDILIVSITGDDYVNKGPGRPAFNENIRSQALAALEIVDFVTISYSKTSIEAINLIKPRFYSKGKDYINPADDLTNKITDETKQVKANGGKIVFTNDELYSASNLINNYFFLKSDSQEKFMNDLKNKYTFNDLKNNVDSLSDLKVLVIGEIIIDEYIFCDALGKSGKESVLVFGDKKKEKYLGGSLAIARHLSSFCKKIDVIGFIGEKKEQENFINKNLEKNIKTHFLLKNKSRTIIKRRYIDQIDNKKIMGVYTIDDQNISHQEEKQFVKKLDSLIKKNDLIIIADYGHGMFPAKVSSYLSEIEKYKCLNSQINSTNLGHHNIRKYTNINNLIINSNELRHEMREREEKIEILGIDLKKQIKAKNLTITKGRGGVDFIDTNNKLTTCPAFGSDPIDKIGAGDAMFALLSACFYRNVTKDISLLIGSLAAAQSVNNMGNSIPVNKTDLLKAAFHLMK